MLLSKLRKYIYPIDIVVKNVPVNSKILDLGCGDGHIKNKLKNKNFKFYKGIDPKIKFSSFTKDTEFSNKKMEDVLDEIQKFDCILMIDVMHHIDKKKQYILIRDILEKMSPESTFVYKDISSNNIFFSFVNKIHDLVYNFEVIHYFDSDKIIKLISNKEQFSYVKFYHRILWYDHEFLIIKKKKK